MQKTPTPINIFRQKITLLLERIEGSKIFSRFGKKTWWIIALLTVIVIGGSIAYLQVKASSANATASEILQTAVARRGDLVVYASGTGTLIALDEVDLAFKSGGQVKNIHVNVGDNVQEGELLAEVDDTDVQIKYRQAERSLLELTSVAAVASAEQAVASAQTDLVTAINQLSYLISPQVYYWETEVERSKQEVEKLNTSLEIAPNNADLKQKLVKEEGYLDFAEDKLKGNWYYYKHEYLEFTFTAWDRSTDTKYIAAPSEAEIAEARAGVTEAKATLQEAEYLYAALTGGVVPEDATGSGLSELETAQLNLESAQAELNGTRIVSPIAGTVMSVDTRVGDTVNSGTTIIKVSDLSQPYLEVFLDESDWANIDIGYEVDIVFDIIPEKTFTGEVTQVDPGLYSEGNTSVVRALVRINQANDGLNLPLSTSAAVDVIGGRAENAILIPVEALRETSPGEYAVFVVEDGRPRLRVIEVGIKDLLSAEVKSGLEAGDVVTTGITETK